MKYFIKKISIFLLIAILIFSNFSFANAAEFNPPDDTVQPCKLLYHPITGDQYSTDPFPSFSYAKRIFGVDRTYYSCYHYYLGITYNYYYCFADETKQYFRVAYVDDDIILNDPIQPVMQ